MTLADYLSNLYERFGYQSAPPAAVTTRFTDYLNKAYREVLGWKGMNRLREQTMTFSCIASTPFVVLPQAVKQILNVQDRVNRWELDPWTLERIRELDPGLTMSGAFPYAYAVMNLAGAVVQDPSTADKLYVKSDSASDGATKTAYVEGIVTGGYFQKVSVALNGVTAAQLGTLATWEQVTKFYVALTAGGNTTAAGNISLLQTSGIGTELARIPPGAWRTRYSRLHLYPTPSQVNTYYADVEIHVENLVNTGDEPIFHEDYHPVLEHRAAAWEYQRREKMAQISLELADWTRFSKALKEYVRQYPIVQRVPLNKWSQLGPYYPPGS